MASLSSKGQVQRVVDPGRAGMKRRERNDQETTALGQGSGSLSRDTRNGTGTLYTWEKRYIPYASFRNEYVNTEPLGALPRASASLDVCPTHEHLPAED